MARTPDPPERDVDALGHALTDADPSVRDRAARALGDLRSPAGIPALAAAVLDGSGGTGAVWALTQFEDPRVVAPLHAALRHRDATSRALAAGRLADLGAREAVAELIRVLGADDDAHVREEAAGALGRLGDPCAVPALVDALRADPADHVREEAATALGALGDASAAPALRAALADRHPMVPRAAADSLSLLQAAQQQRPAAVDVARPAG